MRALTDIEDLLEKGRPVSEGMPVEQAGTYLQMGEDIMRHWLTARELQAVDREKEGFRLLAWQRQASKGDPSFNACRETCREIAWHYNLICQEPGHADIENRLFMMHLVVKHLCLFITNRMMDEKVGEFCCSSKTNRINEHKTEFEGVDYA